MAVTSTKRWTIDDLDDLPDGRVEVWSGKLVEMPSAGGKHSSIAGLILTALNNHVRPEKLGQVTGADGGYVLSRDPTVLFIPDVAFVRAERMPEDFERILEVVSPADRMDDVDEKVEVYLKAGVRIVWVVLPRRQVVQVHRSGEPGVIREVGNGEELDGGDVLPGLRLPVAEIFA